jgi:hypothetical protein
MPHLRLALIPAAAVAAVGLAACGGGSDADSGASADAKAQDAGIAFARCMRAHGVQVDDPKGPGLAFHITGRDPARMEAAQKACNHYLRGAVKPPSAAQQAKVRDNALQFARCMRQHGVDFPDPQFEGGKVTMRFGPGQKMSPDDPTLQAAQRACQHFMGPGPKLGGPPGAGRSTSKGSGPQKGAEIQVGPTP